MLGDRGEEGLVVPQAELCCLLFCVSVLHDSAKEGGGEECVSGVE